MKIFVLGGSGATGKLLVAQLLAAGHKVSVMVRNTASIPPSWAKQAGLTLIQGNISEKSPAEIALLMAYCDAGVSCLGHNMTFKGLFGHPRLLVTHAVKLISDAALQSHRDKPFKILLMNSAGCRNKDVEVQSRLVDRLVIGLIRLLVPPHRDNENAAEYLRTKVGQQHPLLEWVIARPDTLVDEANVTAYSTYPSPQRNPIFNPGKTSRINVAHFMAQLLDTDALWNDWQGKMPVIYNETS